MRKKWKRSFVTALSVALAVGNCVPAMAASTGWKQTAAGWQYVNSNGSVQKGWFQDTDGKWYFLDYNTGVMKNGWIKPKDGKWYFMDYHTGAMKTGWIKPKDGKWYYLGASGDMKTGWLQTADGKYYYLDAASGAMQTGTITVNNQVWTLDANGVWDGKSASSVTYVSSGRPSGGGSSSTTSDWKTASNGYFKVNKKTKEVQVLKGSNDPANPTVIDAAAVDKLVSGASKEITKLTIKDSVGEGSVELVDLNVTGDTEVNGGGYKSIYFKNCTLKNVKTNKTGENPLRVLFTGTTKAKDVNVSGANVTIAVEADNCIENIVVANGVNAFKLAAVNNKKIPTLGNLVISGTVVIKLEIKVGTVKVEAKDVVIDTAEGAGVNKIEASVENTPVVEGAGEVAGYYDVVLNAGEGSWTIKTVDANGEETEEEKDSRTIKVKKDTTIGAAVAGLEEEIKVPTGKEFNNWYTDKDLQTPYTAEDKVTANKELWAGFGESNKEELVVSAAEATVVSGTAVTTVKDSKTVNVAVTTSGSAVSVKGISVKTQEDSELKSIDWAEVEVKVGTPFKKTVTLTPVGEEYKATEITINITVTN